MADGKRVATMAVPEGEAIQCIATSRDGRWIAGGLGDGRVLVWDATTYRRIYTGRSGSDGAIYDVDFSPDSTRLICAAAQSGTATIWDLVARRKVRTLNHSNWIIAVKYSPEGDRIATATWESIRVWDSDDGRLLVNAATLMGGEGPTGNGRVLWCKNHLFVPTQYSKIREVDAATGSTVSEWSVPFTEWSCIALPQHGKFIASFADKTITFWDTTTRSQLSLIQHARDIRSIACSSDGQLLAIADEDKIIVKELFPHLSVSSMLCLQSIFLHPCRPGART